MTDIEFAPDLPCVELPPAVEFVTFAEFVSHPVPQAEPLVTDPDGATVIPAAGLTIVYGTGGAGKTTLILDAACHFAAGVPWLDGLGTPARALHVLWIENEGPREEFRRKLERKLSSWGGRIPDDHLVVMSSPWAAFDLRSEDHREHLAATIDAAAIDLVIVGPLSRLGMEGGGTPDDVRAFVALLEDVQTRAERPVSIAVLHHENRAGQISGAWEGAPDLLVHVQAQGHGRTRLFWQKSRWSSALHGTSNHLLWQDGEGFAIEDRPEVTDATIAEGLLAAALEHAGASWRQLREGVTGNATDAARVRDKLLADGILVNTGTTHNFKLWAASDPALTNSGSEAGTTPEPLGFPTPDGAGEWSGSPVPWSIGNREQNHTPEPGLDGTES